MNTAVRAVVFDVDGVLVQIRFPAVLPQALGLAPTTTAEFFDGPSLDCLLGAAHLRDVLAPFLPKWGWRGSFEEFVDFWFEEEFHVCLPVLEFADRLRTRGIRCFIASTQEHFRAAFLEQRLGVGTRFERAFFSCRMKCRKPAPGFYAGVSAAIGLQPSQILLLDDQNANVEGAKAMGWHAACFRIGDDITSVMRSFGLVHQTCQVAHSK